MIAGSSFDAGIFRSFDTSAVYTSDIGRFEAFSTFDYVKTNQFSVVQTSHSMIRVLSSDGRVMRVHIFAIIISGDESKAGFHIKPLNLTDNIRFQKVFIDQIFFFQFLLNSFKN